MTDPSRLSLFRLLVLTVERVVEWIVTALAALMLVTIAWQVTARFLPFLPAAWTEELARYAFLYMALFGAALAVRGRSHFGLTLLSERLTGARRARWLRWAVHLPILVASILLFVFGWRYFVGYGFLRRSSTFLVPMAWVFVSLPLAALPMILFALDNLLSPLPEDAREAGAGDPAPPTLQARG